MKKNHTLIVGGTKGIGHAVAQAFAKQGHTLSVISRSAPSDVKSQMPNASFWSLDLQDKKRIHVVLSEIIKKNGKLNNLLFFQRYRSGEKKGSDDWVGELEVSLTATKEIIEYLSGDFQKNNDNNNSIVIISSIASRFIVAEQGLSYHVAKAGINQMINYYAVTLGPIGIRVNGISPGTVLKEESKDFYLGNKELQNLFKKIIPIGRMTTSEDIANLSVFLCSSKAGGITGQNITLDGGLSLKGHESMARILTNMDNFRKTEKTKTKKKKK